VGSAFAAAGVVAVKVDQDVSVGASLIVRSAVLALLKDRTPEGDQEVSPIACHQSAPDLTQALANTAG